MSSMGKCAWEAIPHQWPLVHRSRPPDTSPKHVSVTHCFDVFVCVVPIIPPATRFSGEIENVAIHVALICGNVKTVLKNIRTNANAPFAIRRITTVMVLLHVNATSALYPLIARFMGPTWGPPGADRTQVGPMWATWTMLSGSLCCQIIPAVTYR